jgi:mono/diheme cytochrome c family protein
MVGRLIKLAVAFGALGFAGFMALTEPAVLSAIKGGALPPATGAPDVVNGKSMFYAGGCASCHATEKQDDKTRLGGGHALKSPFGTFYAPNISPHPRDGIGAWTPEQFLRAMREGVSPEGRHYYPSFPYTSYQRMNAKDVGDLFAFIKTLAPVEGKIRDHDLPFPFNIRRSLGGWKLLFMDGQPFKPDPTKSAEWNRGAYLVEGPGHCAECHSPRNALGAIQAGKRFAGGPDPEGKGYVPNITPHATGLQSWSKKDLAYLLESGFTPEFDSVGGTMTPVIANTSQLSAEDRLAMAEYLANLPPIEGRMKVK